MCDLRVHGALLFRYMVAGLCWHFGNFPWLRKVFLQTPLHFTSQFCNLEAISQQKGNFAGGFAAHFAVAKWALEAAKWHTCAWGWFSSCEIFYKNKLMAVK